MSLKFRVIQVKSGLSTNKGKIIFRAQQERTPLISLDDLAREVAEDNTLSSFEVKGVLEKLVSTVIRHAGYGHRVSLGELGVIQPQIRGKFSQSREEFNTRTHITSVFPRFNPTRALREAFNSVTVEQVVEDEQCKKPRGKSKPDHPAFEDPSEKKPKEEGGGTDNAD